MGRETQDEKDQRFTRELARCLEGDLQYLGQIGQGRPHTWDLCGERITIPYLMWIVDEFRDVIISVHPELFSSAHKWGNVGGYYSFRMAKLLIEEMEE